MQTFFALMMFLCAVAAVVLFIIFIIQWIRKKPKMWIGLSSVFCLAGIIMFTIIGVSLPENNLSSEEKTVNKNVIDSIEMKTEEKILLFERELYSNKYFYSEGVVSDLSDGLGGYSFIFYENSNKGIVNSSLSISKNNKNVNMKVFKNGECVKIHGYINDNKEIKILAIEKADIGFSMEDIINAYKENCEEFDYESIARNPDQYKGKYAKFTGEVIQVLESGKNVELRVNVTKGAYMYEDTIYVTYTRKNETESRILENDIVTIYGTLEGLKSYESILKTTITIPQINAKYIDINN